MDTNIWINDLINELEEKRTSIDPGDFRFYNIAHFPILIKKTDEFSSGCKQCNTNKDVLRKLIESLPEALRKNKQGRKKFEQIKNQIEKHLKQIHKCHFPGYYTALGSFIGFVTGIVLGVGIVLLTPNNTFNKLALITLATLMIVGRLIGSHIDKKFFHNNMQL